MARRFTFANTTGMVHNTIVVSHRKVTWMTPRSRRFRQWSDAFPTYADAASCFRVEPAGGWQQTERDDGDFGMSNVRPVERGRAEAHQRPVNSEAMKISVGDEGRPLLCVHEGDGALQRGPAYIYRSRLVNGDTAAGIDAVDLRCETTSNCRVR